MNICRFYQLTLKPLLVVLVSFSVFGSCNTDNPPVSVSDTISVGKLDVHSFANLSKARTTHLELDLEVDFDKSQVEGTATWNLDHESARWIVFDTDELEILSVLAKAGDNKPYEVNYTLGKPDDILGRALKIPLTPEVSEVIIEYRSSPEAEALQWLSPTQAGSSLPFMFSQGQAILTRSWIPIQDSPNNRITYNAKVKVPKGMMAVMSAENSQAVNELGMYQFSMPEPIPPYLLAIAVGDLKFEPIGNSTGVYANPAIAKFAATEFAQVDSMMSAAERLYGPYPWGRYDILVLPASFPFGGMENPKLTFATPTILVGDSSLTSLIAHELAHSWSGNLVTNATWDDFWLNEGITTYIERRIMEEVSGRDYADMLLTLGRQDLMDDLTDLDSIDQHLRLQLDGRNPDDGMTDIAYEKGSLLMQALEASVGREEFDTFLRKYFRDHQFQTITTDKFISYCNLNLLDPNRVEFDLEAWIDAPGLPENAPSVPVSQRFAQVDQTRQDFITGDIVNRSETLNWSTNEWLYFLRGIPYNVDQYRLNLLDQQFKFKHSGNSEIAAAWFELSIRNGYAMDILPEIEDFVVRVGRRKFLTPLYRAMKERGMLTQARVMYKKASPGYHAVTRNTMEELLFHE